MTGIFPGRPAAPSWRVAARDRTAAPRGGRVAERRDPEGTATWRSFRGSPASPDRSDSAETTTSRSAAVATADRACARRWPSESARRRASPASADGRLAAPGYQPRQRDSGARHHCGPIRATPSTAPAQSRPRSTGPIPRPGDLLALLETERPHRAVADGRTHPASGKLERTDSTRIPAQRPSNRRRRLTSIQTLPDRLLLHLSPPTRLPFHHNLPIKQPSPVQRTVAITG